MGSEIVFLFTPLCALAIAFLLYCAFTPATRISATLVLFLSGAFSALTVSVVPNYSFWTQVGFYSFAFLIANVILVPALLTFRWLARRMAKTPTS
jgi:hypothetical protein